MIQVVHFVLKSTSRVGIRNELVQLFLNENCGTGTKELTSKYNYTVECTTINNLTYSIILKRPAYLNKGFDFIVSFPDYNFNEGLKKKNGSNANRTNAPSHTHISNDLRNKKAENPVEYLKLKALIDRIYNCENIEDSEFASLNATFATGLPPEIVLKLIKWLFIEQDVTYWNFSGRAMLYGHIVKL
jgi:hypothetical protein